MKLKLDENLPATLATRLRALGFDADTVLDEGLGGRSDGDVWAAAQTAGRFLVTQDLDFSDARVFAPGTHHGILLARVPDDERPMPPCPPPARPAGCRARRPRCRRPRRQRRARQRVCPPGSGFLPVRS
ncbi:MAG: DUF5615 family PIN-like protein [Polyangiaceae bacterium]|nr:DUF5615 family PIN-like protein [Polyangiaceae bacterium]